MYAITDIDYPTFATDDKNKMFRMDLGGTRFEMSLDEARQFAEYFVLAVKRAEKRQGAKKKNDR